MVEGLDGVELEALYRGVGSQAYPPVLMLKIALLEYAEGRTSPAQWARDAREHEAVKWLGHGIEPSRSTCYSFRDRVGHAVVSLHVQMIAQALEEGLLSPETGVQDGTIVRACASRHRLLNRDTLARRNDVLQAAIDRDAAGEVVTPSESWMPRTARGRGEQARRYAKAKETLDVRLAENARKPSSKRLPENKVKVSTSDPGSPLGRDKEKVFGPLYTAQFVVDPHSQLTVSWEVFAQATDAGTLAGMIEQTQQTVGGRLKEMIADAAYSTLLDLQACQERNVELFAPVQENDFTANKRAAKKEHRIGREQFTWLPGEQTYVCPQGHRLDYQGKSRKRRRGDVHVIEHRFGCSPRHCAACPLHERCVRNADRGRIIKRLEGQELLDAHREKMKTPKAQAYRKLRGQVIERTFADAKRHRNFRQLHGRGLPRARAEFGLLVLTQNAITLHRLRTARINRKEDTS